MEWKTVRLVRGLASLRLAVALLAALAAALAAGSLAESLHGPEAARHLVFRAWWFRGLLLLLFLNVAASLAVRIPLRRRQYGFAATHAGILVLLAGAAATAVFGTEGVLVLSRGVSCARFLREDGSTCPLPFALRLRSFEQGFDPASRSPASFSTRFEVRDLGGRLFDTAEVSMNRPFDLEGYRFYQSGFETGAGPTRSVLAVGRDPGRPLKVLGGLLAVLGIAGHFWIRRSPVGRASDA